MSQDVKLVLFDQGVEPNGRTETRAPVLPEGPEPPVRKKGTFGSSP